MIDESFQYRDESNNLTDQAQNLIAKALRFPELELLKNRSKRFDKNVDLLNYSVSLTDLNHRLDASYHVPLVDTVEKHLQTHAHKTTKLNDARICQSIILPGRFRRVYVEEGKGRVFIGGKQIYDLDPSNKKYLSLSHHRKRIEDELTLRENMTLISCSGTIGKVNIVPNHWDGWTANQHIIRLEPSSEEIAGYLYAWLASVYAYPLIVRFCYGAVIDEINDKQVSQITVPLLRDCNIQKLINDKVLEANQKRTIAYRLEKKALKILDSKVIFNKLISKRDISESGA